MTENVSWDVENTTFNNATPGDYDLTYTVTDANSCTAIDNITVTVLPVPVHSYMQMNFNRLTKIFDIL